MTTFIGSSQAVRYTERIHAGTVASSNAATDPCWPTMRCLSSYDQRPRALSSCHRWRLRHVTVPETPLREKTFVMSGSHASLLPSRCDVPAVGIGAINNELRTPTRWMPRRTPFQSTRSRGSGSQRAASGVPSSYA